MRIALAALIVACAAGGAAADRVVAPPSRLVEDDARAVPGWRAIRDADTGVVRRLWGGVVRAPGSVRDAAIAERAARAFVAAHLDVLAPGARISDFALVANQRDGEIRTVAFAQTWRGLPVVGGQVHVAFEKDHLFEAGSEAWPNVAPSGVRGALVLPLVRGRGAIDYRLATARVDGAWRIYEDASGRELLREPLRMYGASTLVYDVADRYPAGARHDVPAAAADITVDGAATSTDALGAFTWAGAAAATVLPAVTGAFVHVIDEGGTPASGSLTAQDGAPTRWSLATDERGDAQLEAFAYASRAKTYARRFASAQLLAFLDAQLAVHVNEDDSCNAFSNGDDVHFVRASATCENTGRLADVVMHEVGHTLHKHSVIAGVGMFRTDLSEGLADYNAANLVEDAALGRGLYYNADPTRDLDPIGREAVWPFDRSVDPHITGLIMGGALWDLRKALVAELGHDGGVAAAEHIYAGVLARAADIPTSYVAALTADDDDGYLGNGTPHVCAIEAAFGRHGLAPAGYTPTSIATPIVEGRDVRVSLTVANDVACYEPPVTGVALTWQVGSDAPQTIAMAPVSAEGLGWTAQLPDEPAGTILHYAVLATFDDGSTIGLPDNAADPMYELLVGKTASIYCRSMDTDPNWAQSGTFHEWEWAVPGMFASLGDPPAAHTGAHALGIDLTEDGLYLASGSTAIATPAIPVRAGQFTQVHLQFWRWLSVEDAAWDQATLDVNGARVWENATAPLAKTLNHIDREWRFQDFDVTAQAASGAITATWGLTADDVGGLGGWTLDDVCLVGVGGTCGNGALDPGEECDDGNAEDGDGCSAACLDETHGGDGGCGCRAGGGSGGALLGGAVLALLRRRKPRVRVPL